MDLLVKVSLLMLSRSSSSCSDILLSSNGSVIIGRKLYTVFERRPYAAFFNIPYAEPPVGDLRFKPPKERKFWINNTVYDFSHLEDEKEDLNEDCLKLSIYTPVSTNKTQFPVLIWIHEHSNFHGPDFFIDEGVLVVRVSFRISIFGFLHTGDNFAKGNMGAKDVLMALKWIKYNIDHFFGDSSRVTVAGSGIGSTITASLILSAAAEDLFTRVIILSGSALSPADYRSYNSDVLRKLHSRLSGSRHKFNLEKFYGMIINASTTKLDWISRGLFDSSEVRDRQSLITSFGCIAENSIKKYFVNKCPIEIYNRKMINNNVDVMFGYNNFERLNKLNGFANNRKLLKYLNYNFQYLLPFEGQKTAYKSKRYNRIRKRIIGFYFPNGSIGERSLKRYAKYHSDQVVYPLLRQAILHCKASSNNVYLYRFGFKGAFNIGWKSSVPNLNWTGATTGDEICYLFRCKSVIDVYKSKDTTVEGHFIRKVVRLMANFVKYGNPTPDKNDNILGTLKWKPLQHNQKLKGMSLANNLKMIYLAEEKRMKFWDQLREELFSDITIKDEL